ncbi:hypothetical protein C5B72_00220 [Acinetobacter sp. KU 011TH]|nr:hypothetical protein C5B72_00220 [Acinetobacter sp. KU 011TH]TDM66819.1 hypothetical protein C4608_00220 [Acinetobacter sp. KU 013TH]
MSFYNKLLIYLRNRKSKFLKSLKPNLQIMLYQPEEFFIFPPIPLMMKKFILRTPILVLMVLAQFKKRV